MNANNPQVNNPYTGYEIKSIPMSYPIPTQPTPVMPKQDAVKNNTNNSNSTQTTQLPQK